jgi:HK97 family phage prohead protease
MNNTHSSRDKSDTKAAQQRCLGIQVKTIAAGGDPAGQSANGQEPPVLEFIASDETLDRYEEVIRADGWDLRHYNQNPVFQNAHNYGDVIHTLGRALVTEVRDGRLFQRIEFAVEANPLARIAYGLYRGKFLNAVSVGFISLECEEGTRDTRWRRRHLKQELLEVSAVGIPANPNALALGYKSGAVAKSDLQELAELCRKTLEPVSSATTNNFSQTKLISLARALRELTRRM